MRRCFTALEDIIGDDGIPIFLRNETYEFVSPSSNHHQVGTIRLRATIARLSYDMTATTYSALINHPHIVEELPF